MPNEVKQSPRKPVLPDPVRPGESWKQYIDRLRGAETIGPSQLAGIISATVLMEKDPNAPANGRMLNALSQRITRQSSFRQATRDPEALRLARAGKGADVIVRMGERKRLMEEQNRLYRRDPSQTAADAAFFTNAIQAMEGSFANHSAVQRERESSRYLEMIKQLEHARSLAEKGIPLDGKSARELAQAIQRYNDGGTKIPGGRQQAAVSKEALCVLKRVMPKNSFEDYCASVNRAHGAEAPTHRRHLNPADYGEGLLNGNASTAKDLMLASQRQLSRGMTLDGCATATAIMRLSGGNPNAVIRKEALEVEVKRLMQPGSAFLRTMSDETARGRAAALAAQGKVATMSRTILKDAHAHSVRSAQWQIKESVKAMGREGGASPERLANILAAREFASTSDPGQQITNGAFRIRAQQIRSDPAFGELWNRYQNDPAVRERISRGLTSGDAGKALQGEYEKTRTPVRERENVAEQPEPQKQPELQLILNSIKML